MITIEVKNHKFEVIENIKDALDREILEEKLTDYYDDYDYIVGDWAYGKLRLKGFTDKQNKRHNEINDSKLIESYIKDYCAYGCKYFILKRINVDKEN